MNPVITLFEHEILEDADDRDIRAISQLLKTTNASILSPIVRQGKVCFQANQFVGVIYLGKRTIQILPKIYRSMDRAKSIAEASRNLLWMLDYAKNISLKKSSISSLTETNNWFETLIHLFSTNLKRQWLKGADRSYQSIEAVLPVLKGKWLIAQQMKRPVQKHQFAVSYDTFTVDNALNRVLRYVVEKLWRITKDNDNRRHLSDLRYWMDEITLLPLVDLQYAQSVRLTRLNQRYEPLLNLAILFLQNLGIELSANNSPAFAFVFNMNQLFEEFLTRFIQRHLKEILPVALSQSALLPQSKQAVVYLAQHKDRGAFKLKPDLVFRDQDSYPTVIDFKYKQLKPQARKLGILESDFYQMYAYLNRFDCREVTLIYPQLAGMAEPIRSYFSIGDSSRRIRATTVNLIQDLTLKGAHNKLITELRQILEG